MNDLLSLALAAHGGLDRWRDAVTIEARASIGGALWEAKDAGTLFHDCEVSVDAHRQRVTMRPSGMAAIRYEPGMVSIEDAPDERPAERRWPAHLDARLPDGQWDVFEAGLFNGRALWTYLTQPFLYASPGFQVEEIDPWREAGETWRSLKVSFPPEVASHGRVQITRFGPDGLIRRHDYGVDLLGGARGVNYAEDYLTVAGLSFPARRRVHAADETWNRLDGPPLVTIDLTALRVLLAAPDGEGRSSAYHA